MHMGAGELAQTRVILPVAARILSRAFPELAVLGAYPVDVLSELALLSDTKHLPASVRQRSFIA